MAQTDDLRARLRRLDDATAKLPPEEAIRFVEMHIADPGNAECRPHLEFLKGVFLTAAGRKLEAAEFMDRCAARDHDIDGVQHQAGEYLLEAGEFTRAIARLNRCLELADISGDRWYENSARLMRAYCAAKIGDFDLAARDADGLESDGGLGWLAADPVVCKRSVLEMINGTQEPK